jgi:hypothetical protein
LVRAAQQAIDQDEERNLTINTRMVGGIAQEIDARSEVRASAFNLALSCCQCTSSWDVPSFFL